MSRPSLKSRRQETLKQIALFFVRSIPDGQFNGMRATKLLNENNRTSDLKRLLKDLIQGGDIDCTFLRYDINIHIRRMPSLPKEKQIELLESHNLDEIGCYPKEKRVSEYFDLASLNDFPFSQMLAADKAQLDYQTFDFAVLERYVNDPRFSLEFEDYAGRLSIRDQFYKTAETNARDNVSMQTFGLGFDPSGKPVVVAFLRYLSPLSREHQLYWKSYSSDPQGTMCRQYFQSSIEGNVFEHRSLVNAIRHCIVGINAVAEGCFGKRLFREGIPDRRPQELTIFTRPTKKNFQRFALALDHFLSENLEENFFPPLISRSEKLAGSDVLQKIGTIRLLQNWLFSLCQFEDESAIDRMIFVPLREVRRLRQSPAHRTSEDEFDSAFYEKRRDLLADVLWALTNLFDVLSRQPNAPKYVLPQFIREGHIDPW